MRRLVIALSLGALAGCAAWDWNADDGMVGYTQGYEGRTVATAWDWNADDNLVGFTAVGNEDAARTDPVTGEEVTADSPWRMEHEGRTYYFTDRDSYETFRRNPSEYAEPRAEAEVR